MKAELREELAAIFDKDQGVTAPLKPARKKVPSGSAVQDEIWAIEALLKHHKQGHQERLEALGERFANDMAPLVARLEELRGRQTN